MNGKKPSKPPGNSEPFTRWGLTENIWNLMEQCWNSNPQQRPTARAASQRLPRLSFQFPEKCQREVKIMSRTQFRAAVMEGVEREIPSTLVDVLTKVRQWFLTERIWP